MKKVSNVVVYRGLAYYDCRMNSQGWRCGKCLRGFVTPEKNDTCRVCGAVVVTVYDENGASA